MDWANAEKLTVRLEYPVAWGTSNPVQGALTPAMDIRKEYEFSLEFTPDIAYTLQSWQVYRTSDLNSLGNWLEDPTLITPEKIAALGSGEVTPPAVKASGGTFNFIIHTTEPVTLVPWCDTQPRITRTEPRDISLESKPSLRTSDIVIYFNSALDTSTVKFAENETFNGIWITAESLETNLVTANNTNNWYSSPKYANVGGFFTITMNCITMPPANSLMTVTVKGIKNAQGKEMSEYSFSWKTPLVANVELKSYSAEYKYDGSIEVKSKQKGADNVKTYYRLNDEQQKIFSDENITNTSLDHEFSRHTGEISSLNNSGVLEGISVSNIKKYEIIIELYSQGLMESKTSFKIWNFPGMIVRNDKPTVEITSDTGDTDPSDGTLSLSAMTLNNPNVQYVLANDIEVSGHTPIGTSENPFTGKFYGNGHMITVSGNFADAAYTGVFGNVSGASAEIASAEIRDLTVNYRTNAVAGANAIYIGGLAGYVGTGAKIRNIVVICTYGAVLSYTNTTKKTTHFGGIAGELNGAGTLLDNAYSRLNINLTSTAEDNAANNTCVGGIAGYLENASITNCVWAAGTNLVANCESRLYAGGIAGKFYSNTGTSVSAPVISETRSRGNITVNAGYHLHLGGFTGQAYGASEAFLKIINSVYETGEIKATSTAISESTNEKRTVTNIGGFAGTFGPAVRLFDSGNLIENLDKEGNDNKKSPDINGIGVNSAGIILSYFGNGNLNLGGFVGNVNSTDISEVSAKCPLTISEANNVFFNRIGGFIGFITYSSIYNCHSDTPINIIINGDYQDIGGLIGASYGNGSYTIKQCSTSGNVFIKTGSHISCGGLMSYLPYINIEKCRATGNVKVQISATKNNAVSITVGGLLANTYSSEVTNSYATGNVEIDNPYNTIGNVVAGGLIGSVSDRTIKNCFALGSVTVQSDSSGNVCAGGLAGLSSRSGSTNINKCVALGETIIVKSNKPYNRINRICVLTTTDNSYNFNTSYKNYALNVMYLEKWDKYRNGVVSPVIAGSLTNGPDGENVTMSELVKREWWFNDDRGFNNDAWSSIGIERGYPRLAWEFK